MSEIKLFLSYPSSEIDLVRHISDYMKGKGLCTWYAAKNLPGLEFWPKEILTAIKSCDAFVLLFCKASDNSTYIQNEVSIAVENHKPVFCLRIENAEPENLKIFLNTKQWHDWFNHSDDSMLDTLSEGILSHVQNEPPPLKEPVKAESSAKRKRPGIIALITLAGILAFRLLAGDSEVPGNIFPEGGSVEIIVSHSDDYYSKYAGSVVSDIMSGQGYRVVGSDKADSLSNFHSR